MTEVCAQALDYASLVTQAASHQLAVLGGFHPHPDDDLPKGTQTVVLLGPLEPGFWPHLQSQSEFLDGHPEPLDRWSRRVVGRFACATEAKALFPFSGPPWRPFIQWALRTGQAWQSPVGLLIHQDAGLFFSVRGALALKSRLDLPAAGQRPCDSCQDQPCREACPVGAFADAAYDTTACHSYLESAAGARCMTQGCAVRRACPVSQSYPRQHAQSAFHMRAFHGTS